VRRVIGGDHDEAIRQHRFAQRGPVGGGLGFDFLVVLNFS
jgi:hypothetical protein